MTITKMLHPYTGESILVHHEPDVYETLRGLERQFERVYEVTDHNGEVLHLEDYVMTEIRDMIHEMNFPEEDFR